MKDGSINETITIGDVFLHRTGYDNIDLIDPELIPPCEAYKELIKKEPSFKPGTAFRYSTHSYWFINALVHKVLGYASMDDFLEEWLFESCQMNDTSFCASPERALDPHYLEPEEMNKFMAAQIPGSGLWSCPDDLMNFAAAVITPEKLFSLKTFEEMTEAYPMVKYEETLYSCRTLGWNKEIQFNNQPQRCFYHGGATGGVLWCDPEYDFIALFMASKWGAGNGDAFNVIKTFYGE